MNDVAAIFARRGLLERALPGYEARPQQARMADEVERAIASGRHLLVEAGTGIGKSLAYLVPALLWAAGDRNATDGRRVVVSTYTRALQEQLARQDLPLLERALAPAGLSIRHALLMGSENYLCIQRLAQARRQPDLFRAADGTNPLETLGRHARTALSGLRSEVPFPVPDEVWTAVQRDRDICLGARGPFWEACLYRLDLARAREADCLVVNHALFFRDLASGGRILPPHDVAILDEAHRAEEAAAAQSGSSIGPAAVSRLLHDVRHAAGPGARRRGRDLADAAALVSRDADPFFAEARRIADSLIERRSHGRRAPRAESDSWSARLPAGALASNRLLAPLRDLETALDDSATHALDSLQQQTLAALALRARDLRGRVELFLSQSARDTVYWAEGQASGRGCTLRALPIEVAPMLRQRLFNSGRTVILTSATLAAGGSFAHLRARLGLTAATEVALGSPYDYARQALLYLPVTMPDPVSEPAAFGAAVALECRRLITASGGGSLILFTSYALLHRVHDALLGDPALRGMPIYRHSPDGTATTLLEGFRSGRRGVLLGTLTFWQGVDVPGPALRCVIITRLPFEVPDHPAAEARAELILGRGGDPFTEDSLPEAVLTFRQGFGRLIRSGEDRGVVAVLDPRLATRGYGATFLESLPPCPRTSSLDDVTRFFAVS